MADMRATTDSLECPAIRMRSNSPWQLLVLELRPEWSIADFPDPSNPDARDLALGFRSLQIRDASGGELAWVDFRLGGNLCGHVLHGFSYEEEWGTWSLGKTCALYFWLEASKSPPLRFELKAHPHPSLGYSMKVGFRLSDGRRGFLDLLAEAGGRFDVPPSKPILKRLFDQFRHTVGEVFGKNRRQRPRVSIVIVNRERPELLYLCLQSLTLLPATIPFEVIITDNGSSPETTEKLRWLDPPHLMIRLPENVGFGEANNLAAQKARGEFLFFLNNDAFPQGDILVELLSAFQCEPDCGIVGSVMKYPNGSIQEAGCFLDAEGYPIRRGRDTALPERSERFVEVDYVSGACLMVRRRDFLAWGGFDLKYSPAYYEDTDLCMRARIQGKTVLVATKSLCYHIENATSSRMNDRDWAARTAEDHRKIFLERWESRLQRRNLKGVSRLTHG